MSNIFLYEETRLGLDDTFAKKQSSIRVCLHKIVKQLKQV